MSRTSLKARLMQIEKENSFLKKVEKKLDFSSFSNDDLKQLIHYLENELPLPAELQFKLDAIC